MIVDDTRPPSEPTTPLRRWELVWLCVVMVFSTAIIRSTSARIGPTFDEPFYLTKGLEYWRTGSPVSLMRAGTMPLPVDVQTLPLYLWELRTGETVNCLEQLEEWLPVARAMNRPFWWLLLASGFLLARTWGGPRAAAIAVGLLGFEPNLVANAALATTDIAVTAGTLAATVAFVSGRERGWPRRILLPGVWAGFAVLCKASAIMFVPIVFAIVMWHHNGLRGIVRESLSIGWITAVLIFAYVGSDWATEPSFVKWANTLPDSNLGLAVRGIANNLQVFPNAAEGIVQQIKHNIRGHGVYSLGEYHARAVWYYFPVLLSQKLTEPVLVFVVLCGMFRPRAFASPAGSITLILFLFSLTCRVQIGIRLVFPLVAFLILAVSIAWCGQAVPRSVRQRNPSSTPRGDAQLQKPCGILTWVAALCVLANFGVSLLATPHGQRYQNQFWGGSSRAGEYLTDSNFDWGQGIPELREWWATQGEPPITLWYYGTDPNAFRSPFSFVQLHVMPDRSPEFVRSISRGGFFVVGRTFLTACPDRRPDILNLIAWLNSQPPVAQVGCFNVYNFN